MPDLVAQGPVPEQTWRRPLPDRPVTLGRTEKAEWAVPWDANISGVHAELTWQGGKLHVRKVSAARNPVLYRGHPAEAFAAAAGETFLIGRTRFSVEEAMPTSTIDLPSPVSEMTFSARELQAVRYADAADRIEILSRLPSLIRFSPSEEELEAQVTAVLLGGIPGADIAAVVQMDGKSGGDPLVSSLARREGRSAAGFRPSRRLVLEATRRRRQPVLHRWVGNHSTDFTATADYDWALCAPLPDAPTPGWALYVTGETAPAFAAPDAETAGKQDLKFAGLVADLFGALRQVRDLQRRRATLEQFLSPTVLAALADKDMDAVLRPRQADVTVLFCDLRGFSRLAEAKELSAICDRVSEALSVMTRNIIDKDGVVGDFQGDAAMGFWGWPLSADDQVEQAARAALAIRREFLQFSKNPDHPLADFACGVGLAHGPAIAGRLGTPDQFKVSVFGPVVNLASRLESLTKTFRVPILMDEAVATHLADQSTKFRLRRLARVQPYGMARQLMLHELMPPRHEPGTMPEGDQRDYEAALDHFLEGRWRDARALLENLPYDGPSQTLLEYVLGQGGQPPADWDGLLVMQSK